MSLEEAVKDFPLNKINTKAPGSNYTPWRLLEHIRITQWDVLNFIQNPKYKYMKWPADYWPPRGKLATAADWKKTISSLKSDLKKFIKIVKNPKTDFNKVVPWGDSKEQTIFREIILVADHNSYHIGEFAILRAVMKTWPKGRTE